MDNYCILPFNSVSINATGEIRQCCNAGKQTNIFADKDDILNSKYMREMRRVFASDKRHSDCNRCWKMEDQGTKSFRHYANNNPEYGIQGRKLNLKGKLKPTDIEYIDITLGNKCNLACRMCNPYSSSLLGQQLSELGIYNGPVDVGLNEKQKEAVLKLFEQAVNLKAVYMLGGEPLINPLHDELLQLMIDNGSSKNISLHYNTNLQVNKLDKYLDKWNQFKKIDLQASIDGSHEVYNYIRWPGNWDKVYKNLYSIVDNADPNKFFISITSTLQNINAVNVLDLIDECSYIDNKPVPFFFIPVVGTMTLDITPKHILKDCIERIKAYKKIIGPIDDLYGNYVKAYESEVSKKQAVRFFNEMKMFDQKRNQNLFDTIPFMIEVAEEHGINTWQL